MFTDEKVKDTEGVKPYVSPKIKTVIVAPYNSILQDSGVGAGGDTGGTDPWE
ncbi:MAG: hypothetical protein KBT08_02505 [Bacteroidales bacterium]|nr:hypothetical protein [Candidatus Cryptobacteroides onthequi]